MPPSRKNSGAIIDEILKWTKTGLTWGQNIDSVVPIPAYGLISPVLIVLIDQIAAARANKKAKADVLEKIQTLANIVGESREELVSRIVPLSTEDQQTVRNGVQDKTSFRDPFEKFLNDLSELEALSKCLEHKNYLVRIAFSSKDAEIIKQIQDGVSNATEFFKTRCLVATRAYLEIIHDVVKAESDNRILESLPHADSAGYRSSTNAVKSEFLEGTRAALFVELEKWIEGGSSDKPVCILSGGAGTGKSTVASELAKRLNDQEKLGASFFFDRGVADLDSTRVFFPTIAYQLAHWTKGTLRQPIIAAARVHLEKGTSQAMKYGASALLHVPLEVIDKESPIFIIIDALDECTQDAFKVIPEMLDLLIAATQHGPLRIFLTSRPDQLIEYKLQSSRWMNIIHTISIDAFFDDAGNDIAAFIKVRLGEIAHGSELLLSRPTVVAHLADQAQGVFIYARTVIEFLESFPGSTLEEGVDLLLSGGEGVPVARGLDQLYLSVLANAFPPAHLHLSSALRARVQSVLACLALLRTPMTPRALESLTSQSSAPITCQDAESVLDRLRSVVVFKRGALDEVFRPMHATFPQFLIDAARCTDLYCLIDPRRRHAHLAEACLRTVLGLDEYMCKLDQPALQAQVQQMRALQAGVLGARAWDLQAGALRARAWDLHARAQRAREADAEAQEADAEAWEAEALQAQAWDLQARTLRTWAREAEAKAEAAEMEVLQMEVLQMEALEMEAPEAEAPEAEARAAEAWEAVERASYQFMRKLRLILLPKHMQYACMSWAAHLRLACTPEEHQGKDSECFCGNLVELLQCLIRDSDTLKRLEIINLMGKTGCSLDADLNYARNWLPLDKQYDTLRSQLQAVAEDDLSVSKLRINHAVGTAGEGLLDYIYRALRLVNVGTLPRVDLATGHV